MEECISIEPPNTSIVWYKKKKMTLPNINSLTGESTGVGTTKEECIINNISSASFKQEKLIANGTNKDVYQVERAKYNGSERKRQEIKRDVTDCSNITTPKQKALFKTILCELNEGELTDYTSSNESDSGGSNQLLSKKTRFTARRPLVTRSLPASPEMSPRLLRRTKEKTNLFEKQTTKVPCPPKHAKTTTARRPVINQPEDTPDPEDKALDEEIRVLNLSSSHPTDQFLLRYALHRTHSLDPKDRLPSAVSPSNQQYGTPDFHNNTRLFTRHKSMSVVNSPTQTPTFDVTNSQPSKRYLASRRQTVAYDRSIQLRKTFQEWLDVKTHETRRRSLNLQNIKEIEQLREDRLRKERFEKAKTFDEWKQDKEEVLKQQTEEAKEKQKEEIEKQTEKEKQNEELRAKKYNEWLVKKFEAELAEEERKIQELRNSNKKEKLKLRRLKSK